MSTSCLFSDWTSMERTFSQLWSQHEAKTNKQELLEKTIKHYWSFLHYTNGQQCDFGTVAGRIFGRSEVLDGHLAVWMTPQSDYPNCCCQNIQYCGAFLSLFDPSFSHLLSLQTDTGPRHLKLAVISLSPVACGICHTLTHTIAQHPFNQLLFSAAGHWCTLLVGRGTAGDSVP